jgi:hypothetical protein
MVERKKDEESSSPFKCHIFFTMNIISIKKINFVSTKERLINQYNKFE